MKAAHQSFNAEFLYAELQNFNTFDHVLSTRL